MSIKLILDKIKIQRKAKVFFTEYIIPLFFIVIGILIEMLAYKYYTERHFLKGLLTIIIGTSLIGYGVNYKGKQIITFFSVVIVVFIYLIMYIAKYKILKNIGI